MRTQDGAAIVLQGQDLPRQDGNGNGYLEIHINVPTPTALTSRQRDLLTSFVHERPQDQPTVYNGFGRGAHATVPMAFAAPGTTLIFHDYTRQLRVQLEPGLQNETAVPYRDRSGNDARVNVEVVVPTLTSARQRDLLRALAEERGELPRRPSSPPAPTTPPPPVPQPRWPFIHRRRGISRRQRG